MGQVEKNIVNDLRDIVDPERGKRFVVYSGKVVAGSVDEGAGTCKVVLSKDDEASPTGGVMINAVVANANGFILYPTDGSDVWVAEIDGSGKYGIIKCSNIYRAVVMMNAEGGGDKVFTMTNDVIESRIGNYWVDVKADQVFLHAGAMLLTLKNGKISIKNGSSDFKTIMDGVFNHILAMTFVPTVGGVAGTTATPVNSASFTADKAALDSLFF